MSTAYFDSSVLVPLFVEERHSAAASEAARRFGAIPFTGLHRVELATTFELKLARNQLAAAEVGGLQAALEHALGVGWLRPARLEWEAVFATAEQLARRHAAHTLARSLDILHVAAAISLKRTTFVSADDRQLGLATRAGLGAVDIKRSLA